MIGVYAPEDGRKEETEHFYNTLKKEVDKPVKTDHLIIAGDLNARVDNVPIPGVTASQGESTIK